MRGGWGGRDERRRAALHLNAQSRVLIVNSEGATDRGRYAELVGMTLQEVG